MPRLSSIQCKALLLLVTFTASFTVVCHCECTASAMVASVKSHRHSCCDKMADAASPAGTASHVGSAGRRPEHNPCQGMQAVKFHLLEKQAASAIHTAPAPLTATLEYSRQPANTSLPPDEKHILPQHWSYRHSPPNLFSLYQRFLI